MSDKLRRYGADYIRGADWSLGNSVYLAADVDALLAEIRAAVDRARPWERADCDCAACVMFRAIDALVGSP